MLKSLAKDFITDLRASGKPYNTVKTYRREISKFVDWCEKYNINFKAISAKQMKQFRNYLVSLDYSPMTVNMAICVVKVFYDFLIEEGVIPANPVVSKRLVLPLEKRTPRFLTEEEISTIFDYARKLSGSVQLALKTLLATGIRIDEAANLRPTDVVVSNGAVFLRVRGKRKKERYVPVTDKEVAEELIARKNERAGQERLLLSKVYLQQMCIKISKETGVHFHARRLRHTIATRLVNKGVRLDVVQDLLGHENVNTTRRYAATLPTAFFQIAAKVS
jgi:site-specific recombinase XerD